MASVVRVLLMRPKTLGSGFVRRATQDEGIIYALATHQCMKIASRSTLCQYDLESTDILATKDSSIRRGLVEMHISRFALQDTRVGCQQILLCSDIFPICCSKVDTAIHTRKVNIY